MSNNADSHPRRSDSSAMPSREPQISRVTILERIVGGRGMEVFSNSSVNCRYYTVWTKYESGTWWSDTHRGTLKYWQTITSDIYWPVSLCLELSYVEGKIKVYAFSLDRIFLMLKICGTWVFISTILLLITQEDCIVLMCHELQIFGIFLLISGWWHDQVYYVFPWSSAVVYVGCAADNASLCIYGKYCVCVCVCVCVCENGFGQLHLYAGLNSVCYSVMKICVVL